MALKELFFKVTYAECIDLPLSTKEMQQNPTFSMYIGEYHEKLLNVMYRPVNGFDEKQFIKLITRKLKLKYKTTNVDLLEIQNKIQE